jgi:hypothetical protein
MPRFSQVEPKDVREKQIAARVKASKKRDNLPIWEGKRGVECPVIDLPLTHILLRLGNGRTIDAQKYAIATSKTFTHIDGSESVPATEEIFDPDNEGNQDSQDHQYELLVVEAKKTSGRVGHQNLMQIMETEGWLDTDRPVVTPDGVLINGNCRVSAIEFLIRNGTAIPKIDKHNPSISVKVVPTPPTNEASIDELERELQLGEKGKLDYDWIQITTDMMRKIETYETYFKNQKVKHPEDAAFKEVHNMYSHLEAYKKPLDMEEWIQARNLLEHTLTKIGKSGQAYGLKIPQQLFKSSIELVNKASKKGWWTRKTFVQLQAIVQVMLQVSLASKAKKELRYEIEEIKSEEDLEKMLTSLINSGSVETKTIEKPGKGGRKSKHTELSVATLDDTAAEKTGKAIRAAGADIREGNDDKDLENKPKKKLEAVIDNLRYYSEAMERAKVTNTTINIDDLKSLFEEINNTVEKELKELE